MAKHVFSGANEDQYSNQGRIWEIAKRNNEKQKVVRKRQVGSYEPVSLI